MLRQRGHFSSCFRTYFIACSSFFPQGTASIGMKTEVGQHGQSQHDYSDKIRTTTYGVRCGAYFVGVVVLSAAIAQSMLSHFLQKSTAKFPPTKSHLNRFHRLSGKWRARRPVVKFFHPIVVLLVVPLLQNECGVRRAGVLVVRSIFAQ